MSDFVPPAEQEFEWIDSIDWSYWIDNPDIIPEPLGSFDAGQSGVSTAQGISYDAVHWSNNIHIAEQYEMPPIDFGASLSENIPDTFQVITTTSSHEVLAAQPAIVEVSTTASLRRTPVPTKQRRRGTGLKCNHSGCENTTFSRNFELQRHLRTFHHGSNGTFSKPFACKAQGCFNKQSAWAFTRPDKLTSHIRSSHHRDTIFTNCPVTDCVFGPSTLERLGVHVRRAHRSDETVRAILNASPCRVYRCPIWTCRKHMKVRELPGHVENRHSFEEAWAAIETLNADCFLVNQPRGSAGFTISTWCPVCKSGCRTIKDFAEHISTEHLFLPFSDDAEHFTRWRKELAQCVDFESRPKVRQATPWHRFQSSELYFSSRMKTVRCPACLFTVPNVSGWERASKGELTSNHHLSLLRPEKEVVDELRPFRFQILRLYPEFVTHPVFDDFDPPKDK